MDAALLAAVADADRFGDVELAARAVIGSLEGSAWFPRAYAEVDVVRIRTMRHALRRLPARDSDLRCRVMLALANELYYAGAPLEIEALIEQGLAMARRIDDKALLLWAIPAAYQSLWLPSTAEQRYGWMSEAVQEAQLIGDARGQAVGRYLLAGAAQETGRIDEMREQIDLSRRLAQQYRLTTVEVALGWLEAPWLALQGQLRSGLRADRRRRLRTMQRTSMNQQAEALGGNGDHHSDHPGPARRRCGANCSSLVAQDSEIPLIGEVFSSFCFRAGRPVEARARYAGGRAHPRAAELVQPAQLTAWPPRLRPRSGDRRNWRCEVYRRIAPYAGRPGDSRGQFGDLAGRLVPCAGRIRHAGVRRCDRTRRRRRVAVPDLGNRSRQSDGCENQRRRFGF